MPNEPTPRDLHRQKLILRIVIVALVIMAVLAVVAVPRLKLPIRLFVASTDLIAAAILWLLLRQKFGGR
jgi:hypothetical protein